MIAMENQSHNHNYMLRFITHLLAQAAGWVALIYIRVPLSSLPILFPVYHAANLELSFFLLPFWALGIWITQIHRQSVPLPRIILTFVITSLLTLLIFFSIRDFGALSRSIFISEVIVSPLIAILVARMWPFTAHQHINVQLQDLEDQIGHNPTPYKAYRVGIHGWERNDFYRIIHKSQVEEIPVFLDIPQMTDPSLPSYRNLFKSSIDIVGATLGLLLLSPIMLLTAALIYLTDRGPIFFVQYRVGLNGQMFPLYKFRSMVTNADALKDKLMDKNELEGPAFKMKRDPRITRIGAIIRKTSIDELPQLFNVLRGHMSLVGPRPHLAEEVQHYTPEQYRRLLVTPGLTCIWQVYGRNRVDFNTWIAQDLQYIDEWSIGLDLRLILLTVPAMIRGEGL